MASSFNGGRWPKSKIGLGYNANSLNFIAPGAPKFNNFKVPNGTSEFTVNIDQNTVIGTPIDLSPTFGSFNHLFMYLSISFDSVADKLIFRESGGDIFAYIDNGLIGRFVLNAYPTGAIFNAGNDTMQVIQTVGVAARVVAYGWGYLVAQ